MKSLNATKGFVLMVLLVSLASCAREGKKKPSQIRSSAPAPSRQTEPNTSNNNGGGGVDGGGGQFVKPTREEAFHQVKSAWTLLTLSRPDNPMLVVYLHIKDQQENKKMTPEQGEILLMLEKILGTGADADKNLLAVVKPNMETLHTMKLDLPELEVSRYLKPKKLNFKEDGLCTGPAHDPAMASVTKLSRDGEVCVSIWGILQQPAASLKADIMGLLIHEIAHLNGYQEEAARKIQDYFLKTADLALRTRGEYSLSRYWILLYYQIHYGIMNTVMDNDAATKGEHFVKIVRQLGFMLPVPYVGDNVPIAKPERYAEVSGMFVHFGEEFLEHVKKVTWNAERDSFTPETLAKKRKFLRDAYAIMVAVRDYIYGDNKLPMDKPEEYLKLIDYFTDPVVLESNKNGNGIDLKDYNANPN